MEIKNRAQNFDDNYRIDNEKIIRDISLFLNNYKNISNNDFYRLLCNFYDIKINDNDYMDYVNYKTNSNYNNIIKIKTCVIDSYMDYEGHGRDFSWWTEKVRLCMKVAVSCDIDVDKYYKMSEIKQLIKENKIYPVCYFYEKCADELLINKVLNDIDYLVKNFDYGELSVNDSYFDYFIDNIKNNIDLGMIYEEIRKYILGRKMYLECRLRDYIYLDEDWIDENLDLINKLIDSYNKSMSLFSLKNNHDDEEINSRKILMNPVDIVVDYLYRLPSINRSCWYDEIEFEQIILILETIDYDMNKELCENIVKLIIDLGDPELCLSVASSCFIEWVDFNQMMDIVIDSEDEWINYDVLSEMLEQLDSKYVLKHLRVVIDSGNAELNYKLALNEVFKDYINDFSMAVINSGDVLYNYLFALNVDGADVRSHGEVIIESGEIYYNSLFALEVPGADMERHYEVLVEKDSKDEYKSALKRILKK